MPLEIFILLSTAVFLMIGGGYVFLFACRRRKELPWLDEEQLKKTHYGEYSTLIQQSDQWLRNHGAQDVWLHNRDGLKLHAYWVNVPDAVGTALLVHGYRSSPLVDFGPVLEEYRNRRLNLLIPSQRSHGKSQGKWITFGIKESKDVLEWIHFHNKTFGYFPIVLFGLSMGASTVMYMLDERLPDNVRCAVVDCGFTSPRRIIGSVFTRVTHLPEWLFLWPCEWFARVLGGFSLYQKDSFETLKNNILPILMVHGKNDDFVPCAMTEAGFAVCGGDKRLLLVDGADHGVSYLVEPRKYIAQIDSLLRRTGIQY